MEYYHSKRDVLKRVEFFSNQLFVDTLQILLHYDEKHVIEWYLDDIADIMVYVSKQKIGKKQRKLTHKELDKTLFKLFQDKSYYGLQVSQLNDYGMIEAYHYRHIVKHEGYGKQNLYEMLRMVYFNYWTFVYPAIANDNEYTKSRCLQDLTFCILDFTDFKNL